MYMCMVGVLSVIASQVYVPVYLCLCICPYVWFLPFDRYGRLNVVAVRRTPRQMLKLIEDRGERETLVYASTDVLL